MEHRAILSEDKLEEYVNNILGDFSNYMQNKIDAAHAIESIKTQLKLMEKYEYKGGRYDSRSQCILPKHAEIVDLSLMFNMKKGVARYILTLRHEGNRKYAVHKNNLVYMDPQLPPTKLFDQTTMAVYDSRQHNASHQAQVIDNPTSYSDSSQNFAIRIPSVFRVANITKTNTPEYPKILCPTNNLHCCYLDKNHTHDGRCDSTGFKCCIGDVHYGKD